MPSNSCVCPAAFVNDPKANTTSVDPFAQLASPVPDLASTLTAPDDERNNREQDYHASRELEALRLLREGTESLNTFSRALFAEIDEELRLSRERMSQHQRALELSQATEDLPEESVPGSSDERDLLRLHIRSLRDRNSYEGWAPGTTETDVDRSSSIPSRIRYIREQVQDTATRRHRREQELGRTTQNSGRHGDYDDAMEWQTSDETETGNLTPGGLFTSSNSLRTAALLQSVRRQARFSLEQELHSRDPERQREAYNQLHRLLMQDQAHRRARQNTTSNPQRSRRTEERSPESEAAKWLEEAIKYLERLRTCNSHSDRISSAAEGGFLRGGYFTMNRDDFVLDTRSISRPTPTSWLRPGGIFCGSQHASVASPVPSFHLSSSRRIAAASNGNASPHASSNPSSLHPLRSSWISNVISRTSMEKADDSWPVKVVISSIDYKNMTMTGTMEAFNVPNKTSPVQESSITTYLEGEIIDFNRYTLETQSFNADSEVDSTYWRKLEPFKSLSDSEVISNLVSQRWLSEELGQKWVLMRWKGEWGIVAAAGEASELTTMQRSALSRHPTPSRASPSRVSTTSR